MRVTLAQLGVAFSGACLHCGDPVKPPESAWSCATTYCQPCTIRRNAERGAPAIQTYVTKDAREAGEREYARIYREGWGGIKP